MTDINIIQSDNDTVTISKHYYVALRLAEQILDALYAGGVDNWEWYSQSLKDAGLVDDDEEDE